MTTRRLHEIRRLRRELRETKSLLAATTAALRTSDEALQLQPVAESFLKAQVGLFVGALARSIMPKPKPEPPPAVVSTFTGATTVKP